MLYKLFQQATIENLEKEIAHYLALGWQPLGGVSMCFCSRDQSSWKPSEPFAFDYAYVQAMTKVEAIPQQFDPEMQTKTKPAPKAIKKTRKKN